MRKHKKHLIRDKNKTKMSFNPPLFNIFLYILAKVIREEKDK